MGVWAEGLRVKIKSKETSVRGLGFGRHFVRDGHNTAL